jgi:hypothetical protein
VVNVGWEIKVIRIYANGKILTDVVTKYAVVVSSDQQLAGENTPQGLGLHKS